MSQKKFKRRIKIIKPQLQLKLVGIFVGLSALAVLLQSVLVAHRMTQLSAELPVGGQYLIDALPGLMGELVLFSFGLVIPLIFAVGVLVTHRIAGPVYRFEQYLTQVANGESVGPCRIRKGDELQELCEIINRAALALRESDVDDSGEAPDLAPMRKAG
jgi:signal peptidase II